MPVERYRVASWAAVAAALLACVAGLVTAARAGELVIREVDYTGDGVSMGYLAYPADAESAPGIILIHEWWGLNDQIRTTAHRFAAEGYVALAIDLYGGELAHDDDEARALASTVRSNSHRAFTNLSQAVAFLASFDDEKVDEERLASIGWGFGGGWSYQMALNNLGTRVSVIYYGVFNPRDDLEQMRSKIIGHFAEEDRSIPLDMVRDFQTRLQARGGGHEIHVYPGAGHAFANETRADYNEAAAGEAWERTLEFLRDHL